MKFWEEKSNQKTALALLFVISGAAGLIYQVVWFKYLSLFLGNTTYAQMTVLASFLGGLAIGNFLIGKKTESFSNPVRIYAVLELAIGIYCLAYPALSLAAGKLFISVSSSFEIEKHFIWFNIIRFLLSAALLIGPTIAMGGTLPVLSSFFVDNIKSSRRDIATLYFLNSFGAVVGILFVGFVLIQAFGLNTTIYATAVLNIIVGLCALVISKKTTALGSSRGLYEEEGFAPDSPAISKKQAGILVAVAGLSGLAALLYEMVWVRLLINFLGSSTYAFSIMLLSFISGITIGSLIVSQKFIRRFNYITLIAACQALIGGATMAALLLYSRLPYYLWKVSALLSKTEEAFPVFLVVEFIISFMLILFPTLFMGMSLPLIVDVVSSSTKKIGFSVGKVFSVNTLGTVAGVLLTGLYFLPEFGIKATFEIGIATNFVAVFLIITSFGVFSARTRFAAASVISAGFVIYLLSFSTWNINILSSGVFKRLNFAPPSSFEEFSSIRSADSLLYYKEGINANVAVLQAKDNPAHKSLIINGKPDASTFYDMPTQVMLGQLPMMLHNNAKKIFVVGFGSGTTIGSVLTHPVEKVVCAEISKEVIEAGRFFEEENNGCLDDERLELVNEDAITLLRLSKEKYDVIISEPSNPWIAGIANLFSQEYFQRCYDALDTSGVMIQWFHLYEADDSVVKLVLNTFSSVFKNAQLWSPIANDILLVGSKKELAPDMENMKTKFGLPAVKSDFGRIGITSLYTFLTCQSASTEGFYTMTLERPINSEIHPLLEFLAPKSFYVSNSSTYIYSFDEKFDTVSQGLFIKKLSPGTYPSKEDLINAADYNLSKQVNIRFAYGLSALLTNLYPEDYASIRLFSQATEKLGLNTSRKASLEKLRLLFPDSLQPRRDYNNLLLLEKLNSTTFLKIFSIDSEAAEFLRTAERDSLSQIKTLIQLAKAYFQNSEIKSAEKFCDRIESALSTNKITSLDLDLSDYYYVSAMVAMQNKDYEKVFSNYLALINVNQKYPDMLRLRRAVSRVLMNNASAAVLGKKNLP